MNTNFLIDERDLKDAQRSCAHISDKKIKSWAAASNLASIVAERFFTEAGKDVDIRTCIHNFADIVKEFEISDIYVNGNYVDVRVYFDEEEICVPKIHFEASVTPAAYMFVRMQKDLYQAEVMGFLIPDTITVIDDVDGYYPINENSLVPFEEIDYLFKDADDLYNVGNDEIYQALDGTLENKQAFIKKLIASYDGRARFNKAYTAQRIIEQVDLSVLQNIDMPGTDDLNYDYANLQMEKTEEVDKNQDYADDNYDFSTNVTSNLTEEPEIVENISADVSEEYDILEDLSNEPQEIQEQIEEQQQIEQDQDQDGSEEKEEIDTLFQEEEEQYIPPKRKSILPFLLICLILGGAGYFGYTKFVNKDGGVPAELPSTVEVEQTQISTKVKDAMPVESVEKTNKAVSNEEGNSISIPAIEQNLDASILVSNLRIGWDVPSGYVSNTQAKRYLEKIGKIIQLNLKTELLLLSRPPISNKISVELKYNPTSKSFEAVGIVSSSGEKSIDDIILKTVQSALNTKISISTDAFEKLSGNPVIVIRL